MIKENFTVDPTVFTFNAAFLKYTGLLKDFSSYNCLVTEFY